jgi:hypothetical protein
LAEPCRISSPIFGGFSDFRFLAWAGMNLPEFPSGILRKPKVVHPPALRRRFSASLPKSIEAHFRRFSGDALSWHLSPMAYRLLYTLSCGASTRIGEEFTRISRLTSRNFIFSTEEITDVTQSEPDHPNL